MKLHEIDNLFAHPDTKDVMRSHRQAPTHKQVGHGGYAYVGTDDDANFGDVHRIADYNEGGSTYMRALASAPASIHNNPFFPKLRTVTNHPPTTTVVVSERLLPITARFAPELILAVGSQYFHGYQQLADKFTHFELSPIENFVHVLSRSFSERQTIKSPKLAEAINWIRKLAHQYPNSMFDIHLGNVMWRPGQYQPQLVFTDPIDIDYIDDDDPNYFGE